MRSTWPRVEELVRPIAESAADKVHGTDALGYLLKEIFMLYRLGIERNSETNKHVFNKV